MGLDARFLPNEGGESLEKVPAHQIAAILREYIRGEATRTAIETTVTNMWSLAGQEVTDLGALLDAVDAAGTTTNKLLLVIEFEDIVMLAESGVQYTTRAALKTRMGF